MKDTTTIEEILDQCDGGDVRDRRAGLIRGVTRLEPKMTVSEAGLEEGDAISLVWFDPFVEMAKWTRVQYQDLYVRIPPHITHIDNFAFADCTALVKLVIPESVITIGQKAFDGCSSLTQITIPNSVTSIEAGAFARCSSLKQVEIPDSVTNIGDRAFVNCSSLTYVAYFFSG